MAIHRRVSLKKSLFILSLFCFSLIITDSVVYAQDDKLSVTVYVVDQSPTHRADAFKEAIDIAMRRLTGKQELDQPAYDQIRDFASRYVRGFRYLSSGKADVEAKPIAGVRKLLLKVDFNRNMLRKALEGEADGVTTRLPKVLFWVAESARGKRQVISSQQVSTTATAIKQYSAARGIKVVLPKYDTKESLMVSATDISGGFDSNILNASRAYIVDKVVMLSLERLPNKNWRGAWTLLHGSERSRWSAIGRSRGEAVSKGINQLKQVVDESTVVTINSSARAGVLVEVQNIHSLQDYAKAEAYLNNLSVVKQITPVNVKSDRVLFTVELQSDQSVLERQVAQNNILRAVLGPSFNSTALDSGNQADQLSQRPDLTFIYQAR